jgi:hypothetical protein
MQFEQGKKYSIPHEGSFTKATLINITQSKLVFLLGNWNTVEKHISIWHEWLHQEYNAHPHSSADHGIRDLKTKERLDHPGIENLLLFGNIDASTWNWKQLKDQYISEPQGDDRTSFQNYTKELDDIPNFTWSPYKDSYWLPNESNYCDEYKEYLQSIKIAQNKLRNRFQYYAKYLSYRQLVVISKNERAISDVNIRASLSYLLLKKRVEFLTDLKNKCEAKEVVLYDIDQKLLNRNGYLSNDFEKDNAIQNYVEYGQLSELREYFGKYFLGQKDEFKYGTYNDTTEKYEKIWSEEVLAKLSDERFERIDKHSQYMWKFFSHYWKPGDVAKDFPEEILLKLNEMREEIPWSVVEQECKELYEEACIKRLESRYQQFAIHATKEDLQKIYELFPKEFESPIKASIREAIYW